MSRVFPSQRKRRAALSGGMLGYISFSQANSLQRDHLCRRNWWLLPIFSKDDKEWLLVECLEAEVQPLVYVPGKMSAAQLV